MRIKEASRCGAARWCGFFLTSTRIWVSHALTDCIITSTILVHFLSAPFLLCCFHDRLVTGTHLRDCNGESGSSTSQLIRRCAELFLLSIAIACVKHGQRACKEKRDSLYNTEWPMMLAAKERSKFYFSFFTNKSYYFPSLPAERKILLALIMMMMVFCIINLSMHATTFLGPYGVAKFPPFTKNILRILLHPSIKAT